MDEENKRLIRTQKNKESVARGRAKKKALKLLEGQQREM